MTQKWQSTITFMGQFPLFQVLRSLGLVFWSSLPLIGLVFWLGSSFVEAQILSRAYSTKKTLQADIQSARQTRRKVAAIEVEILPSQGVSLVNVKANHPVLKTIAFEFPITDISQLEIALSRELGLPRERVQELMRE